VPEGRNRRSPAGKTLFQKTDGVGFEGSRKTTRKRRDAATDDADSDAVVARPPALPAFVEIIRLATTIATLPPEVVAALRTLFGSQRREP